MNNIIKKRFNLPAAQVNLTELCRYVAMQKQRIEIEGGDDAEMCVLISASELQTLEQALQIYASTDDGRRIEDKVVELCRLAAEQSSERPAIASVTI